MFNYELKVEEWIKKGNFDDAIEYYEEKASFFPNDNSIYPKIANLYYKKGDWIKAIEFYDFSLENTPNSAHIYNNIGHIYLDKDLYPQAEENIKKAVELSPNNPYFMVNLGVTYEKMKKFNLATELFQKALDLQPHNPNFLNSLAINLSNKKDYEKSLKYQKQAVEIAPTNPQFNYNLGVTYSVLCMYEEAIKSFENVIKLIPNHENAHYNLGVNLLLLGRFEKGWFEYEWRFRFFPYIRAIYDLYWRGQSIENKIIYVHAEQGLGDTFQFSRYIKLLKKKKPRKIVLYVQEDLREFMKDFKGIDEISFTPPLKIYKDGFHVCLLSLPALFKTNEKTIPNEIPYLFADKNESEKWKKKLSNLKGLKVGIVWEPSIDSKTYDDRKVPLENFTTLFKNPKLSFVSLQKEISEKDKIFLKQNNVLDMSSQLEKFSTTAGIINNLDLIIGIDTSVIHLAGAMGKKVYLMLPIKPDWRWMLNKPTSPWYPSMKLFRQKNRNNWSNVIKEIEKNLL